MNKIIIMVCMASAIVYTGCSQKQTIEQIAIDSIMHSNFSVNIIPKKHGYDTTLMGTGNLYDDFYQIFVDYSLYHPAHTPMTVEDSIFSDKIHLGFPTVIPGISPHININLLAEMKIEDEKTPLIRFAYGIYNKTEDTALLAVYAFDNYSLDSSVSFEMRLRYIPAVKVNGKWLLNFDCVIDAWPSHTEWLKTQNINQFTYRSIENDFEKHGVKDIVEMPYKKYFDRTVL